MDAKLRYLKDELNSISEKYQYEINMFLYNLHYEIQYDKDKYSSILNSNKSEATIQDLIESIEQAKQEQDDFSINCNIAKILSEYVDLDKLNISIQVPILLGNDVKDFLQKYTNIKKVIILDPNSLSSKLDVDWIRELENYTFENVYGDKQDIKLDELLKRQEKYIEYLSR